MKKIQPVDMDWRENQARLDHYNQWLMDPARPFTSTYPGYTNKNDSYLESVETVQVAPVSPVEKPNKIKRLARRAVTVALSGNVSHNKNTEKLKGNMMTKVTNLSRATEIVKAAASKAEALEKIVATLGVSRSNAFVYFTKASKALVGDAYPNLKAPKAEKAPKAKVNPVTETSPEKAKAKVAEIDKVIAGLRKSGAAVSPFAGLGA